MTSKNITDEDLVMGELVMTNTSSTEVDSEHMDRQAYMEPEAELNFDHAN